MSESEEPVGDPPETSTRDRRARTYASDTVSVDFEPRRCIHAAECVFALPYVFDPERKPWIDPRRAPADAIARVVALCPTGALHATRLDGGAAEAPDTVNRVRVTRNGPLYVRGAVEIRADDGSVVARDLRVALCRCGASRNRPFCDNSHVAIGFRDAGDVFEGGVKPGDEADGHSLRIRLEANGPYRLEGPLEVASVDGRVRLAGGRASLCRCGHSRNKPFCDGSHATAVAREG
jgi:CDGSH-type Zn-finger protein/uncharacterized Fe-S cluster protein YjdI